MRQQDSRMVVLMNPAAGGAGRPTGPQVVRAFEEAGRAVQLFPPSPQGLAHDARAARASGATILVAAGGDGTVGAVAGAVAGTDTAMGVIPLGTFNHFAKDLGLPRDWRAAVRAIVQGRVRTVDLGEVNGRCFINNSSIGLYPRIVIRRERQLQQLGSGKWMAMLMACISVFRRYPLVRVVLHAGRTPIPRTTPFVFVGNNRYDVSLFSLGGRPALDRGELCVYFANRTGRFGLVRLMFRALVGRLEQAADFDSLLLP